LPVPDGGGYGSLEVKGRQGRYFMRHVIVGGSFAPDGRNGRMKSPSAFFFFKPPHFPRNSTAFGLAAARRSMTVAALALPIPKLIMVIPLKVAAGMATLASTTRVFPMEQNSSR